MRGLTALAVVAAIALGHPATAGLDEAEVTILTFDGLDGWAEDDHDVAMAVFIETCDLLRDPSWEPVCNLARDFDGPGRRFFELFFRPVLIEDGADAVFTAYFEPEIRGSTRRTARYSIPVYARPPELANGVLWHTREEIEDGRLLEGRGLEIAWVDNAVDLTYLQIQGSGRIVLDNGDTIRIGYGGSNGHPYRSLGDELVRRGIYTRHDVSAAVIRAWVGRHPEEGADLIRHNPSYVFFRVIEHIPADRGPIGAMSRSITAMRTLAVDPAYTPLGAPVWLEKDGDGPMRRLMVAQDTGSRIKGAQRADIFIGTGDEAGRLAGRFRDPGRMVVLLPIQRAYALKPEG